MSSDNPSSTPTSPHGNSPLVEVARFLQVVRHRISLLIVCVVTGGALGSAWFATATPTYESRADILVLKTEGNVLEGKNTSEQRTILDVMPTYQKILTSDAVLEGAIKKLPMQHRIDLKGVQKAKWSEVLRKGMTVSSTRMTNILNVKFVSKSPQTAAFVVSAIVDSYLDFMKQTHKSNSKETLALLTQEKSELEQKLFNKEKELLSLKQSSGVLLQGNDKNTNVTIERTVKLNEALVEAMKRTLEARAYQSSLAQALQNGSDIAQFMQQAAGGVSSELMLKMMGVSSGDAYTLARFEERLVTDQTELTKRQQTYGPNHPLVRELQERIHSTERWLGDTTPDVR